MNRPVRALLLPLLAVPVLLVASCGVVLPTYDAHTRRIVLQMIGAELPYRASMVQMKHFLGRHTTAYDCDSYSSQCGGFMPQTGVEKAFFDRKVGIYLQFDGKTPTLRRADVRIFYTFL